MAESADLPTLLDEMEWNVGIVTICVWSTGAGFRIKEQESAAGDGTFLVSCQCRIHARCHLNPLQPIAPTRSNIIFNPITRIDLRP